MHDRQTDLHPMLKPTKFSDHQGEIPTIVYLSPTMLRSKDEDKVFHCIFSSSDSYIHCDFYHDSLKRVPNMNFTRVFVWKYCGCYENFFKLEMFFISCVEAKLIVNGPVLTTLTGQSTNYANGPVYRPTTLTGQHRLR